ncbi:MAG: ABC transporter ATP-binding protein [Cardiobacteriaceae bacterium]|nr:ABC transporter ATP-binding protein [Cardiobacteriaceae bacterium]
MNILQVNSLHFGYPSALGEVAILNGVDLTLSRGESVAIVGASGSGKSTLLHLLAGLDLPKSGTVRLCEQDFVAPKGQGVSDDKRSALRNKHMGFVYQFHHLLAEFTALENVALPLRIAGVGKKEAENKALSLLERVGLKERAHHLPSELSGGERQRAAIARALVNEPDCLLADEPTGNLDQENAQSAFALMQELISEQQRALIIVTHDISLAKQMQRCYHLRGGLLVED